MSTHRLVVLLQEALAAHAGGERLKARFLIGMARAVNAAAIARLGEGFGG